MRKLYYIVIICFVLLFGVTFTYQNHQTINLAYLGIRWSGELSILLFITLALGMFAGWFVGLLSALKVRRRFMHTNHQIRSLETK